MFLIANWKLNKNLNESLEWFNDFAVKSSNIEVIVAPSYLYLPELYKNIQNLNLNIKLSAQDVSKFEKGSYTGEISAYQLKDFCSYVIVGHSERKIFNETLVDTIDKIHLALKNNLKPIVCFSNVDEFYIMNNSLFNNEKNGEILYAYEPIAAIGTGKPATSQDILQIKEATKLQKFIYGGSVDENSINEFLNLDCISGFLVGSASLDSKKFSKIYTKLCE
jgi:triosephosphate isomerase